MYSHRTHLSRDNSLHGEHLRGLVVLQNFSGQNMSDAWIEPYEFALKQKPRMTLGVEGPSGNYYLFVFTIAKNYDNRKKKRRDERIFGGAIRT